METLNIFLYWTTSASTPWWLCEDVRRSIVTHYKFDFKYCGRCHKETENSKHINVCFVRGERLCFNCYHKNRWPKG